MIEALTQYVAPSILGGICGLASVQFSWNVEKRRARLARRQALIDSWRAMLEDWPLDNGLHVLTPEGLPMARHAAYPSLRPYLDDRLRKDIEGYPAQIGDERQPGAIISVGGAFDLRNRLIDVIADQERAWELV